ncbi:MAG: ribose-phosphate pyrophosphokinase [Oscillospiraceae bacterium]|jgi:ribose-phosphate pyrophosphokinase|nr:ribose-phosphate pyrophosphokinase [Oscillospiraceae bacterium]
MVKRLDVKIFAGSSVPKLALKISEGIGVEPGNLDIKKFSDSETSVSLFEKVNGYDCYVVQSTCFPANDNLMELLIIVDALRRESASKITAVIPYFGYARQDRKIHEGEPITAKLTADLITCAGADKVLTMDFHSAQIQGFFNIPVKNISGMEILADYIKTEKNFNPETFVAVAPDLGAVARVRKFAERVNCDVAVIEKRRSRANESKVMGVIGDVKDKNVILLDDMIDTAGTIEGAAVVLKEMGCKSIFVCASHAVLSGKSVERLSSDIFEKVILLDTIEKDIPKFKFLSTAKVFADEINLL